MYNPLSSPTLPGTAGPAQTGQPVVYDPSTGLYVNQSTGGVSTDPGGQHPVQNPSLATQAARNIAVSNGLLAKLGTYGQQYQQAFTGQTGLTQELQRTINGTGAPTVAQGQLQQGLGQIRSAANSEAAGATGANAALARQNATLATGEAATKTNQDAALLRAQEVAQAEQVKGQVLGSQAGESAGMYGSNLSGATAAAGQAGTEEGTLEAANQAAKESQDQLFFNEVNPVGTFLAGKASSASSGATAVGGGGGAASGGSAAAVEDDGADAISDRREKTNVKKLGDGDMEKLLSKISGYGFDYKNPGTPGENPGQRVGVMAQDVKKGGPVGKSMVVDGNPMKLDLPNAVGAALAAVAYLKKRIDKEHGREAA